MKLTRPPRPVIAFFAIDIALGVITVVAFLIRAKQGLPPIDLFSIGSESNLPTWYASSKLLLIGLLLAPIAFRDVSVRRLRTWPILLLPAFFILLSLDETAMLHERAGWVFADNYDVGADLITGPWMYVVAPFYGCLAWFTFRATRPYIEGRATIVFLCFIGVCLFAFSAVGLEYAANLAGEEALSIRRVLSLFEEVGEMVAATTLLWSVLLLLSVEQISVSLSGVQGDEA